MKKDTNWALSMAAAIPSGVIKIFEGVATFGAASIRFRCRQRSSRSS